ncbi:MAG: D-alanine--D-alanine ligase [Bacteroidales bacterium]|nr:D-alanine--D-alanine ligase [Bacteroidales bacterium]NLK80688.1 D-alanine--D-alanine ligase [Bacteroidales bacterium]HPY82020.1 D-alanine--D-alanine ligase [Bacteroidales bacterium]
MKKNIAILGGGFSSESEISKQSTRQLCEMMDSHKYNLYAVFIESAKWYVEYNGKEYPVSRENFSFSLDGTPVVFDCVYNTIHGTPGEDGRLSSYFELLGIPYTNSGVFTSALTFNKYATKVFLHSFDILSAQAILVRKHETINPQDIVSHVGLPCFVKPNNAGSSFGVSKVYEKSDVLPALEKAFTEDSEVIVESFVDGIEISNGVYKLGNEVHVLPITEIQTDNDFFDYQAKYEGKSIEITPAKLPDDITQQCYALTEKIYEALDCKGICRVDYIISQGNLYFLEINTVPGMSKSSIIPQQIRAAGLKEADVFSAIIENCLAS